MKNRNLQHSIAVLKSQFTGFFAFIVPFIVLTGCQPATESTETLMQRAQSDPSAAVSLASERLAQQQPEQALIWLQQAAILGDAGALEHALQLQQRLQGRLATAQWLQQQARSQPQLLANVSDSSRQVLGLWTSSAPASPYFQSTAGCALTLQPVVSQLAGAQQWLRLLQQWQQDPQLMALPVCFLPQLHIDSTRLNCTEQADSRIHCDYTELNDQVVVGDFSQLLIVAGRGTASYNNGILQLPDNATLALLRHEFMHVLGFIDEYALSEDAAAQVCNANTVYPNIIVGDDVAAYLQHWRLSADSLQLTPVASCDKVGIVANRVVRNVNLMRYYETTLPELYWQLAQKILKKPHNIMPVQYYFAYLARQQQNWPLWQQLMQQASDYGYSDAQLALAP